MCMTKKHFKNPKDYYQALKLIEDMIYSDAIQDLELKKNKTKEEKICFKKLMIIYKIVHTTLGECKNSHEDWVEEVNKLYEPTNK